MNIPSEDIKDLLEGESSLALVFTDDLFIAFEPSSPDDCVTIFDTPGGLPNMSFDVSERYDRPSIQIRVRNRNYVTGLQLTHDIKDFLHRKAHETVNGTYYSLIQCTGEPAFLDWDENRRARFIVNFDIQRR